MSLAKEFKEFIARGNVIDLAVGVIIGAAFGKSSLVGDGYCDAAGRINYGRVDFSNLFVSLNGKAYESLAAAQRQGRLLSPTGISLTRSFSF